MARHAERGFSMLELLISLTVLIVVLSGLSSLLIQNSRLNRSQQLTAEVQANARNCLEIVAQKLRSAGWDPSAANINVVTLDPDPSDDVSEIEIFADLDGDGLTDKDGEQILIRHQSNRIEWRTMDGGDFEVLATNISNDADGDGTIEPMFTPLPDPDPTRILVRITARSPSRDPRTKDFIRYTVTGNVALRKNVAP